jgi:PAS domain S-box-containing protein
MSSKPTYKELKQKVRELEKTVSEHDETEDALKESENRYRSIVRVIPDLIIKFNREGIYLDIISPTEELLFMPKEKLLGLKLTDIMPKDTADRSMEIIRKSIDDQVLQVMEYELQVPAGIKYFESRCIPLDENSVYCLVRDVTDQKLLEKEKEKLIKNLQDALGQVKTLKGLLPICSSCKKIRDDQGYWKQIEVFISSHSEAEFTHSLCPKCLKKLYPDFDISPDDSS